MAATATPIPHVHRFARHEEQNLQSSTSEEIVTPSDTQINGHVVEDHVEPQSSKRLPTSSSLATSTTAPDPTSVLHRSLHSAPLTVLSASGNHLHLSTGATILDATGGAAVACLGHAHPRIAPALTAQLSAFSYIHSGTFTSPVAEALAARLTASTRGAATKALFVSSGSEAMETALKLARQYWVELGQGATRTRFVSRNGSYHGNTLGALGVSGHVARRKPYEPLLANGCGSRVSACYAYRGQRAAAGEDEDAYAERLAAELEAEFVGLGPRTVCAFVAETVVGAALGCVPPARGYLSRVRRVCDKYDVLLILDEVMCGVGRTGTMHAWEQEGVAPDIQTLGKGLGGGYVPIAAVLVGRKVVNALDQGTGAFVNGQTYSSHAVACAGALEVLSVIEDEDLLANVRRMGKLLGELLRERLGAHPHVGDVRGRGLFWGLEFVADRRSKAPFALKLCVANGIHERGLAEGISLYPGTGTVDGVSGDHVLLAPAYNVTEEVVREIVELTGRVVEGFFGDLGEAR